MKIDEGTMDILVKIKKAIAGKKVLLTLFGMTFIYLLWISIYVDKISFAQALNIVGWQGIIIAILAMGTVFPSVLGEFDFSVSAICGICSLFYGYYGSRLPLAPLFCVLLGAALGVFNALIAGWTHISHTIITFVTAQLITMFSVKVISSGSIIFAEKNSLSFSILKWPWQLTVGGISGAFFVLIGILCLGQFIFRHSYQGRCLMAVGENEKNAQQMGVNPLIIKILAFAWSGIFAAFGALVMIGRQGFGEATAGNGFELYSLSAMLLAGHEVQNGRGTAIAIIVSGMFVAAVRQCCMRYCYPLFYSNIMAGFLLLFCFGVYYRYKWQGL